jgi:hypothetical protein
MGWKRPENPAGEPNVKSGGCAAKVNIARRSGRSIAQPVHSPNILSGFGLSIFRNCGLQYVAKALQTTSGTRLLDYWRQIG